MDQIMLVTLTMSSCWTTARPVQCVPSEGNDTKTDGVAVMHANYRRNDITTLGLVWFYLGCSWVHEKGSKHAMGVLEFGGVTQSRESAEQASIHRIAFGRLGD